MCNFISKYKTCLKTQNMTLQQHIHILKYCCSCQNCILKHVFMSHDIRIPPELFRGYVVYFVIFNNSPNTANGKSKIHSIMNIFSFLL